MFLNFFERAFKLIFIFSVGALRTLIRRSCGGRSIEHFRHFITLPASLITKVCAKLSLEESPIKSPVSIAGRVLPVREIAG
jgi:hypothetical protein